MKGVSRFALAFLLGLPSAHAATITILNMDGANEGLNDPAPFTPTGGNIAHTLGQARLNVLNEAARIWGLQLGSPVVIVVEAQFNDLDCAGSSGVLGSAGARSFFTGFSGGLPGVLYPAALADALSGLNLNGRNDITAQFNSRVAGNVGCLGGRSFYLGFDHQPSGNQSFDLLNVVLHELAHGLGFISLVDATGVSIDTTGQRLGIFDQSVYSDALGRFWPQMTAAERASSATSNGSLVWNGAAVNSQLATLLNGLSVGAHLRLYAPATWDEDSSVSHWDTSAAPNLLMEPFLSAGLNGLTDLTGCALRDMGWPGTRCPDTGAGTMLPTAHAQTVAAVEDATVSIALTGYNPGGGALTYAIVIPPAKGVLTAMGGLTSSSGVVLNYAPTGDQNGADSFVFQVSNGSGASVPATVSINIAAVNDAPVVASGAATTAIGVPVGVTLSASDVDSSSLSYVVGNPANGTLTGTAPLLQYTPNAGFQGNDSFAFQASDGALSSNIATYTINVTTPAPAAVSGGGGGSMDLRMLAMLLLLAVLRGRWRSAVLTPPAAGCVRPGPAPP